MVPSQPAAGGVIRAGKDGGLAWHPLFFSAASCCETSSYVCTRRSPVPRRQFSVPCHYSRIYIWAGAHSPFPFYTFPLSSPHIGLGPRIWGRRMLWYVCFSSAFARKLPAVGGKNRCGHCLQMKGAGQKYSFCSQKGDLLLFHAKIESKLNI